MSILSDNLYLENIEEYIQDENRIVTYKWLSRTLSVPVMAAKRMLYAYVQRCRSSAVSNEFSISVMYIITGESSNDNSLLVLLVDEEELPESKSQFSTIWSIHVYSVQKSKPEDSSLLYKTDYQCNKDNITTYNKWNTIDCPAAEVLRSNQHAYYRDNPSTTTSESRGMLSTVTNTISSQTKQNKKKPLVKASVSSFFNQTQQQEQTTTTSIKKMEPEIKKKASFFSTNSLKKPSERPSLIKTSELATSENHRQSLSSEPNEEMIIKKEDMSSTEQEKRNDINDIAKKPAESLNKVSTTLLHDSDLEGKDESSEDKEHTVEEKVIKTKRRRAASTGNKSKTKVEIQTKKKRKRIQNLSSDESDSEPVVVSSKEKVDTNLPMTTDSAVVSKNGQKRRKRVKKLVSKMFVEEDGSMVTEKHWEDVSTDASSDEDKIEGSEMSSSSTKDSKTESPSKKGTKQSSLMSFFKK